MGAPSPARNAAKDRNQITETQETQYANRALRPYVLLPVSPSPLRSTISLLAFSSKLVPSGSFSTFPSGHLQRLGEEKRRKLCICYRVCQAGSTLLIVAVDIFWTIEVWICWLSSL